MTYATGALTGSIREIVGAAVAGTVTVVPIDGDGDMIPAIVDTTGNTVMAKSSELTLNRAGAFRAILPATDDVSLVPSGFGYRATIALDSGESFVAEFALPGTTTVDFSDVYDPAVPPTFEPTVPYASASEIGARLGSGLGNAFAGVLATLRRGQRSTCVALIGDSTGDGKEVGTGTLVDEWPQVFLKRLGQDFPGYTVLSRLWNDTNQSYDQPTTLQTGTINAGAERYAAFTTGAPGALQFAGAAIAGDIDVRARIAPTSWSPAGGGTIAAKWDSTGNQRSWLLTLDATGALGWLHSANGSANLGTKLSTVTIPATANPGNGNPLWVRVTVDVDNGAGGWDVRFYYSADGTAWTQLGATVTTATATSIFGGAAPYQLGSFTAGFSTPFAGKVHKVEIHPGIVVAGSFGGSVVPYLPDDWDYQSGVATIAFGGAPVLMLLNGSQSGQNVAYFDNATRRAIVHQPHGQGVLLINTAHNDATQSRAVWLAAYNTLVTNIKALIPYVPIVAVGQNPCGLGGTFNLTQQDIELHAARSAILQQWAASQAGVWSFDAWPLLTSADTIDQLHPTTGVGSGSAKWGLGLYERAFPRGATTS